MDKPAAPPPKAPKETSSDLDTDLSDLIPSLSDEGPTTESDADAESESPDQALSDLLGVLENEIKADEPSEPPTEAVSESEPGDAEPSSSPDARDTEAPEEETGGVEPAAIAVDAEPVPPPETTEPESVEEVTETPHGDAHADDLSALVPGRAIKRDSEEEPVSEESPDLAEPEVAEAESPSTLETDDAPQEPLAEDSVPAASVTDLTETIAADRWRYLKAALLLADEGLERVEDTVDSFHPRARPILGMAGLAMISLALVLFATQLLGWI